jgi:magnesium chelatase subunit D
MTTAAEPDRALAWQDALTAAALLAVDPAGLGGARLRARSGPARDHWLAALRASLPAGTPLRRVPLGIADERLLGGLDLTATLRTGAPVVQRGVLAEADGGLVLLAMAERLASGTAARLAAVLDRGEVLLERDGLAQRLPARLGMVALDEGLDDGDEALPAALADRLAFALRLDNLPRPPVADGTPPLGEAADTAATLAVTADEVAQARARLPQVRCSDELLLALCEAAEALGVRSARAPWLAQRAARAAAALQGQTEVTADDAALAARLVLAPRATRLPAAAPAEDTAPPPPAEPPPPPDDSAAPDASDPPPPAPDNTAPPPPAEAAPADDPADPSADTDPPANDAPLDDQVLAAALAALPPDLLAQLAAGQDPQRRPAGSAGRRGVAAASRLRGRPTRAFWLPISATSSSSPRRCS